MPAPNVVPKVIVSDPATNRWIDQLLAVLNPLLRNVSGDLSGPVASPTVVAWFGLPLASSMGSPAIGEVPKWNGSSWEPGTAGTSGAVTSVGGATPLTSTGGTTPIIGIAGTPAGGIAYANGTTLAYTAAGTSGLPLLSGGVGVPSFGALALGTAGTVSGTLPAGFGGTGIASYAVGDLLIATGPTTLAKLTIGANGTFLGSNGTTASWQALSGVVTSVAASSPLASSGGATPTISLTGTVGVGNGGTGFSSFVAGQLLYATGATTFAQLAIGTVDQVLTSNGSAPVWQTPTASTTGAGIGGYRATSSTPATIGLTDYVVDVTGTGAFVVNLPTAGSGAGQAASGRVFVVKNTGGAVITVTPAGAQLIDTAATFVVQTQFASFTFISTGSGWAIL